MLFNDRSYRVLIVSASQKFADSISTLLPEAYIEQVRCVSSISTAKREVLDHHYDLVLINTPLTDDFGTNFAIKVASSSDMVALMFVKAELYEEITWKVFDRGVYTLSKPTSPSVVKQTFSYLIATRERLRILENKKPSIEGRMEEIRLVNRAKWMLIDNEDMSEADAHHYIEKQAMNTGKTKLEIAKSIVNKYQ